MAEHIDRFERVAPPNGLRSKPIYPRAPCRFGGLQEFSVPSDSRHVGNVACM